VLFLRLVQDNKHKEQKATSTTKFYCSVAADAELPFLSLLLS